MHCGSLPPTFAVPVLSTFTITLLRTTNFASSTRQSYSLTLARPQDAMLCPAGVHSLTQSLGVTSVTISPEGRETYFALRPMRGLLACLLLEWVSPSVVDVFIDEELLYMPKSPDVAVRFLKTFTSCISCVFGDNEASSDALLFGGRVILHKSSLICATLRVCSFLTREFDFCLDPYISKIITRDALKVFEHIEFGLPLETPRNYSVGSFIITIAMSLHSSSSLDAQGRALDLLFDQPITAECVVKSESRTITPLDVVNVWSLRNVVTIRILQDPRVVVEYDQCLKSTELASAAFSSLISCQSEQVSLSRLKCVLSYLRTHATSCATDWLPSVVSAAVENNYLTTLQWLHSQDWSLGIFDITDSDTITASENGYLDVLKWWWTKPGNSNRLTPTDIPDSPSEDQTTYSVQSYVEAASKHGHLDVLQWWKDMLGSSFDLTDETIPGAARGGHFDVLKWWVEQSGVGEKYLKGVFEAASEGGHLHILKWLVNHFKKGIEAAKTKVVDLASGDGHINVVKWWLFESGVDVEYSPDAVSGACQNGHLKMIKWWKYDSGLEFKYHYHAIDYATENGHLDIIKWLMREVKPNVTDTAFGVQAASYWGQIDILDWWKNESGLPFRTVAAPGSLEGFKGEKDHPYWDDRREGWVLAAASECGHVGVLDWWKTKSGVKFVYNHECMDQASANGHVHVLQWWKNESKVELLYSADAIDEASANGHVAVLDWWVNESGEELLYTEEAVNEASRNGHLDVLNWWKGGKGGEMLYDPTAVIVNAIEDSRVDVLQWWYDSNLDVTTNGMEIYEALTGEEGEVRAWWDEWI